MGNNKIKASYNIPAIALKALIAEVFAGFCGDKCDVNSITVDFKVSIETHGCGEDRHDVAVFNGCEVVCNMALPTEEHNADK